MFRLPFRPEDTIRTALDARCVAVTVVNSERAPSMLGKTGGDNPCALARPTHSSLKRSVQSENLADSDPQKSKRKSESKGNDRSRGFDAAGTD